MKTRDIITAILFACLLGWIFLLITEQQVSDRTKQSEINHLRKQNKIERDSLQNLLEVTRKAFKAQNDSIIFAHEKTLKANLVSQKEIRKLKEIIFITHSDSSRQKELKTLYKSYQ